MYTAWLKRFPLFLLFLIGLMAGPALLGGRSVAHAADSQWTARYWNNRNLAGDPVLRRQENNIDHDWGQGSPDATVVNKDNFSARWTRSVGFPAGTYRFTATMDDGMRVWVDDRLIIDSWIDSQARSLSSDVGLTGGDHSVKVEYYDAGGAAVAKLNWAVVGGPPPAGGSGSGGTLLPTPPVANFQGSYFNGTSLSGSPLLVRTDPAINFNWGAGSPAANVPNDRFSVRWTGAVNLDPGRYRFQTLTDDGVRLWVNGRQIIDEWHDARGQTYAGEIDLPGGSTAIQMEYYENIGDARAFLTWGRTDGTGGPTGSWLGQYYNNRDLSGQPAMTRSDAAINFNWGTGSPAPAVNADNFSVRWTQSLSLAAGRYRFTASFDDGVRVWVNGQRIIDSWQDGRLRTVSGEVNVPGGNVPVEVQYFEHLDQAQVNVTWQQLSSSSGGGQPAPGTQVGTATVLVPRLNVRTGPGTRFPVTTVLTQGQTAPMTGYRDATGTWTMINLNNTTAWISALPGYLSTTVPVSSLPAWSSTITGGQPIPTGPLATVGSSVYALNMRTGPGVEFEIIRALRNGTVVQLIGRNAAGSWLQVRTSDGTVGWLSAPFMVTTTSIPTLPITG